MTQIDTDELIVKRAMYLYTSQTTPDLGLAVSRAFNEFTNTDFVKDLVNIFEMTIPKYKESVEVRITMTLKND